LSQTWWKQQYIRKEEKGEDDDDEEGRRSTPPGERERGRHGDTGDLFMAVWQMI